MLNGTVYEINIEIVYNFHFFSNFKLMTNTSTTWAELETQLRQGVRLETALGVAHSEPMPERCTRRTLSVIVPSTPFSPQRYLGIVIGWWLRGPLRLG